MNRRQRLEATLQGRPVDRPAVSFYEIGGIRMDPSDEDPFNVYNDPSWKPLIDLAEAHTDLIRMRSPVRAHSHESWAGQGGTAASARAEFFKVDHIQEADARWTRTTVTVDGRTMSSLAKRQRDIDTIWTVEPLLKSPDDVNAYLHIPDEAFAEDIRPEAMLEEERQLGDRGLVMIDTEDPLCAAATLLRMEDFVVWAMTEPSLIHRLVEKCARSIHARTQRVAGECPGRLWRIYGAEFACEPYLPPALFEEYVCRYTSPMIDAIHRHGGWVRLHCHGRIRNVLRSMVEMGVDAIDPIEPPPQGDVDLAYVRREYGKDIVLFGNIELADLEALPSEEFEPLVDRALHEGTCCPGRGFVLMPSASPYGRHIAPRVLANYELLVEKALAFR